MILKYGYSFIAGCFLVWPLSMLILNHFSEKRTLKDSNHHIQYTVDGDEQVNGIGIIILHLVAYLTLYFVPTLVLDLWELAIVYIILAIFLFSSQIYSGKLGRMMAQNRYEFLES
jgi:hypothetical protein